MHDINGHALKVGDKVLIPAVVTSVAEATEDYCNVEVETTLGRRPDGEISQFYAINTAQLVKVAGDGIKLGL